MQSANFSSAPLEPPDPSRRLTSLSQRWKLWLDGSSSPDAIRDDCLKAIDDARNELLSHKLKGVDFLGLVEALIGQIGIPKRDTLTARMYGNIRKHNNREALLVWMLYSLLGKKPPVAWPSPVDGLPFGSPEQRRYPTIGVLFTRAIGTPAAWAELAPMTKWMSLDALRLWLQQATQDEWQQVQEDWIAITNGIAAWARMDATYRYWQRGVKPGSPLNTVHDTSAQTLALGKVLKLVPLATIVRLSRRPLVRVMVTSFLLKARKSRLEGNVDSVMASLRTLATMVADAGDTGDTGDTGWQPTNTKVN